MAELTTLARPYAKAAFEVALAAGELANWSAMLTQAKGVISNEKVARALSQPSLTGQQQADIVIELCGEEINDQGRNFLYILAENKRLALISEILELFEQLKANQERTVEVSITTAYPLSGDVEEKLAASLKERLQREVHIRSEIDKKLIGGLVVRAGDLVIDGSVRGKLSKLAEAMSS